MDAVTDLQKTAQYHFALGHSRRLRILKALSGSERGLTFQTIAQRANVHGSSLTHHLRILKDAQLVIRQVKGKNSYYRTSN